MALFRFDFMIKIFEFRVLFHLVCLGGVSLISGFGVAQTITLRDQVTGMPIEMATLLSDLPAAAARTNALGQAEISAFRNAEIIEIYRLGYRLEIRSFTELEKHGFVLFMRASNFQYDDIVVSATRWGQTSRDIPSKITTISAADVALQNPQTAADLLGLSGEVFIQKSQQGGGSPMIRGFSTNRLLYSVDGVRMNTAIFRSGNIQNVISLDPFAIENTEVFFGPGSIMYGSDAIGGVMCFQTLTPQTSHDGKTLISGSALARFSSANNEQTYHVDINAGWKKWSALSSISFSEFDDLKMGKFGPEEYLKHYTVLRIDSADRILENADSRIQDPTGYSQINLMQKFRFRASNKWDFNYAFHFSETSTFSRYDRLIETDVFGVPLYAVWNYGPQVWVMNQFAVLHTSNNRVYDVMTFRLAQQYFEESRIDRKLNESRLRNTREEVDAYSANLDFEKRIRKHKIFYGAEYVINHVGSFGSAVNIIDQSQISVPDRYPSSDWSSYGGYLNYQMALTEKINLQAGSRLSAFVIESDFSRNLAFFPFDFVNTTTKNSGITGSLGLVYSPDVTWKISMNASSGFRAPNVDDMGKIFDFSSGEVVVPNANLKAENAYNGEFSISRIFKSILKFDVTGFYTYLTDAMVRREFSVNGQDSILYNGAEAKTFAIQNAAYAIVYGFNSGIELRLPSGFGLSARLNFQRGEEEMEDGVVSRSRHAAPAFGVARFTYKKDKLNLECNGQYCAAVSHDNLNPEERNKPFIYAKDSNGNSYSPNWYTLNFKALYQFHSSLSVSGGVENITDQRYRPYSSGLVAAGRNFIVSMKAIF